MKLQRTTFGLLGAVMLAAAFAPGVSAAQVHGGVAPNRVPPPKPERSAANKANKAAVKPLPKQQYPLDRWSAMPPAQREAALAKLPPERRQNLEARLQKWQSMPEHQREMIRNMTPEQRQAAAQHGNWMKEQPAERQPVIRKQIQMLRQMSPEAREAELNSPSFQKKFSPAEREHIQKVVPILAEPEQE